MKTHQKGIIGLLMSLLLVSCALESKFGLPNDEKINQKLIGDWIVDEQKNEHFSIVENDKKTYKLVVEDKEKTHESVFYSKTINGFNLLNLVEDENDSITNIFYGYKVEDNLLTLYEVNDKLVKEDFLSETELLKFFESNTSKEDFFINPITLTRKK